MNKKYYLTRINNLKKKLEISEYNLFVAKHNYLVADSEYKSSTEVIRNIIKKCENSEELQNIIIPEINHFLASNTIPDRVIQRMSALGLTGVADIRLPNGKDGLG